MTRIPISLPLTIIGLLFFSGHLRSQSVNGRILDQETKEPIGDVFIFYDNTSTGTISDESGSFSLPDQIQAKSIIFSHLNYDLLNLELTSNPGVLDTIFLRKKAYVLPETIVEGKSKPGIRKNYLRQFYTFFLGDVQGQGIKIENPEVLLFDNSNETLQATASEPLLITNPYLGYEIRFYLTHFQLWPDGAVDYRGNAYFTEIEGKKKQMARYKRNRIKVYDRSSRKFFTLLLKKDLGLKDYKFGFSKYDPESQNFVDFEPVDSLTLAKQDSACSIICTSSALTVIDLNQNAIQKNSKIGTGNSSMPTKQTIIAEEAVSHLSSKTGTISIDQFGRIINPLEVEEYGYWSEIRVGMLLPLDYHQ